MLHQEACNLVRFFNMSRSSDLAKAALDALLETENGANGAISPDESVSPDGGELASPLLRPQSRRTSILDLCNTLPDWSHGESLVHLAKQKSGESAIQKDVCRGLWLHLKHIPWFRNLQDSR